jgi:anti-anti-sigma regulatory factor
MVSRIPDVAPAREGLLVISTGPAADGAGLCLRLAGEADLYSCSALEQALAGMVAAGRDVQVDVTAVTFADVAVTRLLALTAARLGPGRRLVLHGASPAVRRLVGLCWPGLPGLEVTDE